MNILIYGQPSDAANGAIDQYAVNVNAEHQYDYYRDYGYFGVYTDDVRDSPNWYGKTRSTPAFEWLNRDRRTTAFADAAGLKPIRTPAVCPILDLVERTVYCDHTTVWMNRCGHLFVLNEPYGTYSGKIATDLHNVGLDGILVPTSISPYCGNWSGVTGALPRSFSYLISYARDQPDIDAIAGKLSAASSVAPAWNDISALCLIKRRQRLAIRANAQCATP